MGVVFMNWQRLIRFSIIQFIVYLACLSNIALAGGEMGEEVTGSANVPGIGLACLGNLAVFVTSLLRGRLDLELGGRDVLATMRGPKLEDINNGFGHTTSADYSKVSVVMLSNCAPNLSMKQFMKYISNAYNVHSTVLQFFPVKSPASKQSAHECKCIVFSAIDAVIILLADQLPGTLKRLSDSLFLLPSQLCFEKGCHGCNKGLLYAKDGNGNKKLTEGDSEFGKKLLTEHDDKIARIKRLAIFETLDQNFQDEENKCICIPLCPLGHDYWTKLLSRSFGIRDTQNAEPENFSTASLIVPRLTEVLINLVLTVWFRVDGFSSSVVARRAIRDYVVDSKGSGFGANAFLTKAESRVQSRDNFKYVCHVLSFRGKFDIRTFSFMVGSVNFICSISWVVLIAIHGSVGKWFDGHPTTLSKPRVTVIMGIMSILLGMDILHLYLCWRRFKNPLSSSSNNSTSRSSVVMVLVVIILEIAGSVVMGTLGIKVFGKWLYSALHVLVWVKWGVGSYLLGEYPPEYESEIDYDNGILVYSSLFLLNSVLAGVRVSWKYPLELEELMF